MEKQLIDRIQSSVNFIEENLYEKIDIEDVVRKAYMGRSAFYDVFAGVLSTTVKEYIRKRRLSLSLNDLVNSDLTVLEIALKYQYYTSESYSRAFKKLFGMSPKNYREKREYIDVFPRITLSFNNLLGGNIMISKEMNKETIINNIKGIPSGYILDIDIDHFDMINKNYGHDIGDRVLFEVPERAKSILKGHDLNTEVIRIGGDEFIVIIKDKPVEFIKSVSTDIICAIDREFNFDGTIVKLSICIGISEFSLNNNDDQVVKNANDAMLQAKENGRNQYRLSKINM